MDVPSEATRVIPGKQRTWEQQRSEILDALAERARSGGYAAGIPVPEVHPSSDTAYTIHLHPTGQDTPPFVTIIEEDCIDGTRRVYEGLAAGLLAVAVYDPNALFEDALVVRSSIEETLTEHDRERFDQLLYDAFFHHHQG